MFAGPFVDETRSAPLCCLCSSVKAQVTEEGVPSQGSLFCTDLPACPEPCSCAWSLLSLSSWPAIPRWLPWVWVSVESHRQSHLSGSPGPALSGRVGVHVTFSRVSSLKDASLFGSAPSRSRVQGLRLSPVAGLRPSRTITVEATLPCSLQSPTFISFHVFVGSISRCPLL